MEVKITIEAPDLAASILKLAEAIASSPTPAPAPAAPVSPAPTAAAPVSPAPVTPAQTPAPTATPPAPTGQTSAAPGDTPAPAAPVTGAPSYTLDQISRAGASLVDAGKMQQLLELLGRYSVQAVTQLKPEQYGAFAAELRGLGAQI